MSGKEEEERPANGADSPKTAAEGGTNGQQPDATEQPPPSNPTTTTITEEFVLVAESEETEEKMELPTCADDNSLTLKTLCHSFPGAVGLKYRYKPTGATRGLMIDSSGDKFFPPSEGWSGTTFIVIYSKSAGGKRKVDDVDDSDSHDLDRKRSNIDDKKKPRDLIVLGLPFRTTAEEMKTYFEQYGELVLAEVKKNHTTGESKGFGFVRYSDYESQVKALSVTDHQIDGRSCQLKVSRPQGGPGGGHQCTKLFVARMSEDIREEDLRKVFETEAHEIDPDCKVTDVFIPKPFRSFGFVSFSDSLVTDELLKRQQFVVNDTSVVVSPAAPRDQMIRGPSHPSPRPAVGGGGGRNYQQQPGGRYADPLPFYPSHHPAAGYFSPSFSAAAAAAAAHYGSHASGRPPMGRGSPPRGREGPAAAAWQRYTDRYGGPQRRDEYGTY